METVPVLLCVALSLIAVGCSDSGGTADLPSSSSSSSSTSAPTPAPPWAGSPLSRTDVPAVLLAEWERSDSRRECPLLAFTDVGAGEGGTPRAADFGGSWAVAWDKPGSPGQLPNGQPSPTVGRSTFGIAGVGGLSDAAEDFDWPHDRTWADGSRAGYGVEGGGADEPGSKWLAYLRAEGHGCLYNVWSHLGRSHLEHLLDGLRRVEGA
jgi:hypothetical protein